MNVEKIKSQDEAIIAAAQGIQVLSALAWPAAEAEEKFLSG